MILIITISADLGLVHFSLGQFTVNHDVFQQFVELSEQAHNMIPENGTIHIVYDCARPHLRATAQVNFQERVFLHRQPVYSSFFNPVEQAHSCFKASVKRTLSTPETRQELNDEVARAAARLN